MFWCIFQASLPEQLNERVLGYFSSLVFFCVSLSNLASEQFSAFLQAIEFIAHDEDMRTNNM